CARTAGRKSGRSNFLGNADRRSRDAYRSLHSRETFAFEPELAIVLQLDRVAGVAAVLPETARIGDAIFLGISPSARNEVRRCFSSAVQFLEIAIDAPLAERDAPLRRHIRGDTRTFGDAAVQRRQAGDPLLEALHVFRERIAESFDDLEQR